MVNSRGQMKIQQMAFMLIAVTFLFILVAVFFLAISLSNLQRKATTLAEDDALFLVSKLANSAEFSCGDSYGSSKANCIDLDKIIALSERSSKYQNFWGVAKIYVRKIYPFDETVCTEGNYPDCGLLKLVDRNVNATAFTSNFVSLCRKDKTDIIYDKCELGLLMVASEDKG